jgi:hypothetical protein
MIDCGWRGMLASVHIYPVKGAGRSTSTRRPELARVLVTCGPGADITASDRWHRIRIGPVFFRVVKPYDRCVETTTDQTTGERGRQQPRMLAARRRFGQKLIFGQNIIPDSPGQIRVGDPAEVTEYA